MSFKREVGRDPLLLGFRSIMPELTEDILEKLSARRLMGATLRSQVRDTCRFLNECQVGRPRVHVVLHKTDSGYGIFPVIKMRLKLALREGKRKKPLVMMKTVYPGSTMAPVFVQILTSFGIEAGHAAGIYQELTQILGRPVFDDLSQVILGAYNNYIQSSTFEREHSVLKTKTTNRLRLQLQNEMLQKFQIMIALGNNEQDMSRLFRQAEIERVIRS